MSEEHEQELEEEDEAEPKFCCKVCGGIVPESELREHLAMHHSAALSWDWEWVRDCYTSVGGLA